MKNVKSKNLVLLLMSAFLFTAIHAQTNSVDHALKAPHAGTVISAGNYHIEMVRNEVKTNEGAMETFSFYLLDGNENTIISKGNSASIVLQTANGDVIQKTLELKEDESYFMMVDGSKKYSNLIINIMKGSEKISAKFNLAKSEEHLHDGHDHKH